MACDHSNSLVPNNSQKIHTGITNQEGLEA